MDLTQEGAEGASQKKIAIRHPSSVAVFSFCHEVLRWRRGRFDKNGPLRLNEGDVGKLIHLEAPEATQWKLGRRPIRWGAEIVKLADSLDVPVSILVELLSERMTPDVALDESVNAYTYVLPWASLTQMSVHGVQNAVAEALRLSEIEALPVSFDAVRAVLPAVSSLPSEKGASFPQPWLNEVLPPWHIGPKAKRYKEALELASQLLTAQDFSDLTQEPELITLAALFLLAPTHLLQKVAAEPSEGVDPIARVATRFQLAYPTAAERWRLMLTFGL